MTNKIKRIYIEITNICNLPTEGNSNAKLLYFFFEL